MEAGRRRVGGRATPPPARTRCRETLELGGDIVPAHRASAEAQIVALLGEQGATVAQDDAEPAGVLGREASGEVGRGPHGDAPQQRLHVGGGDPLGEELLGQHLAVEQGDGEQVRERVVGLLLGAYLRLHALLAAADDVVGDLEDLQLDPLHLGGIERVLPTQIEQRLERRLGVDLCIEALQERAHDPLQVLALPGDLERPHDRLLEALVPLEHLARAGDAAPGEQNGVDGAERGRRVGEALPVRERAGTGDA
jgi:hypothetical protein